MVNLFGARKRDQADDAASVTSSFYDSPTYEIERLESLVQEHESRLETLREQVSRISSIQPALVVIPLLSDQYY